MATCYKALEIICASEVESENDKWDLRSKRFSNLYRDQLGRIAAPVDIDQDGNISVIENESKQSSSVVELTV
jgi:hypothetical protein